MKLISGTLILLLSGCGGKMAFDRMVNMDDMQASKTLYKKCLSDHNGNTKACAAEKASFDADVEAFKGQDYKLRVEQ